MKKFLAALICIVTLSTIKANALAGDLGDVDSALKKKIEEHSRKLDELAKRNPPAQESSCYDPLYRDLGNGQEYHSLLGCIKLRYYKDNPSSK